MKKPVVLMILDGWGIGKDYPGNAILRANTPNYDKYLSKYPRTILQPSGLAVGLPKGVMGNSEVGHLNIGAGRIVYQDLTRINKAIEEGSFYDNAILKTAFAKANGVIHFIGLLSDAGVHSDIAHLKALIKFAKHENIANVYVHAIMDGRDTDPNDGEKYIIEMQDFFNKEGLGEFASISGRFYAMDRDTRWDRVERAYNAFLGVDCKSNKDILSYLKDSYTKGITDEFIEPAYFIDDGVLHDRSVVVFYNFRSDRARELTRAINEENFDGFVRKKTVSLADFVCFTEYDETFKFPVAFPSPNLKNVLGEVISNAGLKQLRIAETEKYAHVTFFLNGGVETQFNGEDRILVDSPRDVATYDLKPEMSAPEVTRRLLGVIDKYDFVVINYANGDMVGHTGVFDAAVKAVETVDYNMGLVIDRVLELGGVVFLTADHGNVEKMIDDIGRPHTAHTTNPVNLILITDDTRKISLKEGKLANITPSILDYMGVTKPKEIEEDSLLVIDNVEKRDTI